MQPDHATKLIHTAIKFVGVLLILGVVAVAWLMWNFYRPPFDLVRLNQLQPGMSKHEVREILGAPNVKFEDQWAYSRFMAWPIVYVRFDERGRFTESEYDY